MVVDRKWEILNQYRHSVKLMFLKLIFHFLKTAIIKLFNNKCFELFNRLFNKAVSSEDVT
jgi:hypothetical protein